MTTRWHQRTKHVNLIGFFSWLKSSSASPPFIWPLRLKKKNNDQHVIRAAISPRQTVVPALGRAVTVICIPAELWKRNKQIRGSRSSRFFESTRQNARLCCVYTFGRDTVQWWMISCLKSGKFKPTQKARWWQCGYWQRYTSTHFQVRIRLWKNIQTSATLIYGAWFRFNII